MPERGGVPKHLSEAIKSFLGMRKFDERVEQTEVITRWASIVGGQIAAVTEPRSVTADGTLIVRVQTHAWMTELSLREPEILAAVERELPGIKLTRIRWQIWRD